MTKKVSIMSLAALWIVLPLCGQTSTPKQTSVVMAHLYFSVQNLEASKKFWVSLGGESRSGDVMMFPGVLVFLKSTSPGELSPAANVGSVVNHVGFLVPNLQEALAKWKAEGFKTALSQNPGQGYVFTPDDLMRVEITEDSSLSVPIAFHHIHFFVGGSDAGGVDSVAEMKAWYVKMFGATPGKRGSFEAADLPGVNLTFSKSPIAVTGTRGRTLDHIGFETVGLRSLCEKLEASGVKFDIPYKLSPAGTGVAFLTDPWGTYIELTEGQDRS
jgi:catechol 2,3-dioxygenase-like lactoylglutathione lyase family enzyme